MSDPLHSTETNPEAGGEPSPSCFAYLLTCRDGTLYAGWTTDLEKRLRTHNAGLGAKYTRARLPVVLAKSWAFETREEAMRFEASLKRLTRRQKLALLHASWD